ncbi:MAG: response regulator [Pseudomonadota bacterium]
MFPTPPDSESRHVVLVDDDEAVRLSTALLLRANGVPVSSYANAEDALAAAEPIDAACLLLDYVLPDMDGFELLARLRADGVAAPALLLTGRHAPGLDLEAKRVGFETILHKPTAPRRLVACVAASMQNRDGDPKN